MYSPRIKEKFVRAMYRIKQRTGISITRQANEAIAEYLEGRLMDQLYDEGVRELGEQVDDKQT